MNPKFVPWSLLSLIGLFLLTGCSDARSRSAMLKKYPDSQVAMVPDKSGHYIIRRADGSVWYAYSDGVTSSANDVVDEVELIPAPTK